MSYILLDESGDLGFNLEKEGTSHYFLITFLFVPTNKKRRLSKIVSKIFLTLKKAKKRKSGVLHAYKESPTTRHRLLRLLAQEEDIKIMTIYLNKEKVYTDIKEEKNILYSNVVNILIERIISRKLVPSNEKIELIASRRNTNKFLNENFRNYIENNKNTKLDIKVSIKSPESDRSLQTVDFASWSIYRKYEKGDYDYYDVIKDKILEEKSLYGE